MIVEEIGFSDKYNLCRLKVSGELFYISYDLFNDLDIKKEEELDFDVFSKIQADNSYNRAKNYILNRISYANKTSFEIGKILRDKGYEADVTEKVIEFLTDYKLVDDESFVRSFIADKSSINGWPKNKIRYKLKLKGIPDSLIDKNLTLIDDDREYEKALYFAEKKARGDYSFKMKNKVYRHLAGKGFDFDVIGRVMGELFS